MLFRSKGKKKVAYISLRTSISSTGLRVRLFCLSARVSRMRVAQGGRFVCAGGVCVRSSTSFCSGFRVPQFVRECVPAVCVFARVRARVCAPSSPLSEASRWRALAPTLAGRGTAVADHYRLRDAGRREFSGVCLRLAPLLNERCSISLIIPPLRLMSLFSDGKVCKKAPLLSGLFAFLIGRNKSGCHSQSPWSGCVVFHFPPPSPFYVCFCLLLRYDLGFHSRGFSPLYTLFASHWHCCSIWGCFCFLHLFHL